MGKILDLNYKSPHSQRIADRIIDKPDAAKKAPKPDPTVIVAPTPKVERKVKVVPVTNTVNTGAVTNAVAKDTTNAARQSRWRSKQDVVALRGQAKERMKGLRAQRKAGKAVGS